MPLDLNKLRSDTPGCANVVHFNNAGAGLMPAPVVDALQNQIRLEAEIGGYEAYALATAAYQNTYHALGKLLNCQPAELALVENATRAWDQVFYGLSFKEGDKVITSHASYASNFLAMLQLKQKLGIEIIVCPNDSHGQISLDDLEQLIDNRVRLIALTHIPTNGGLVNPAAEVGVIARQNGIPFLLDACQSVGQIPIDVGEIGCDFLSATGRKYLRGPRGTGFLYVRKDSMDLIEPPFIDLHAATWTGANSYEWQPDARRFETWEGNVAGKIGMGVAVDYAVGLGTSETWDRVRMLGQALRKELNEIDSITVHDQGEVLGGIVTFSSSRKSSAEIKSWLASLKINVVTSTPDYARIDAELRSLPVMVRSSVHYYNTEEEIGRFAFAIRSFAG